MATMRQFWAGVCLLLVGTSLLAARSAWADAPLILVSQKGAPLVTWEEVKAEVGKRVDWRGLARSETGMRKIVEELAWTRLLEQEGEKRGIAKRDENEKMPFNYPYALAVEKDLTKQCVEPADEAEAKRYYDAHPDAFMTPVRARLQRIVLPIAAKQGNLPAAVWLQMEAMAIVKGIRTFDQTLADARKLNPGEPMGDLGYVVLEEDAPIINALKSAKAGEMVGPYVDGDRVYLFLVQEKQEAQRVPWELVKANAAKTALVHCRKQTLKKERARLFAEYQVQLDDRAIHQAYSRRDELAKLGSGPKLK